jgi:hypothetical protein
MGYSYSTNLDDVAAWLKRCAAGPGLDEPAAGASGTVGDRLAKTLAGRIHDRAVRFVGTAGAWPMNAESTAEAKRFNAPNYETGEMVSEEHIAGVVTSTESETTILYGQGNANADGVTDRDRANFAEEGQSAQRIVRSFFGVTGEDADALVDVQADEREKFARKP